MTRRPDDMPESWHNTYDDEPDRPHCAWIGWLFLGAVAVWLALEFYAWVGRA